MNLNKILLLVGLVLAVVFALTDIPALVDYESLILAVIGLVIGFSVVAEEHVRVLVSALVLTGLAGAFGAIPQVGGYVTAIIGGIGSLAAGAALMIVFRNIYGRVKP